MPALGATSDCSSAKLRELTGGLGAHSVVEAVGTQESFMQAVGATRGGGHLGYVGVNHEADIPGIQLFCASIHTLGGPAPVHRFLPELILLIRDRKIDRARSSTSPCRWSRRPRDTRRCTSAAPRRSC